MSSPSLSRSSAFALDLASKTDGYLAEGSEVIDELRRKGLVTTQNVGDGFMIVRAIVSSSPRQMGFCIARRQQEGASAR